jgi:hypothetical protein
VTATVTVTTVDLIASAAVPGHPEPGAAIKPLAGIIKHDAVGVRTLRLFLPSKLWAASAAPFSIRRVT